MNNKISRLQRIKVVDVKCLYRFNSVYKEPIWSIKPIVTLEIDGNKYRFNLRAGYWRVACQPEEESLLKNHIQSIVGISHITWEPTKTKTALYKSFRIIHKHITKAVNNFIRKNKIRNKIDLRYRKNQRSTACKDIKTVFKKYEDVLNDEDILRIWREVQKEKVVKRILET